MTQPRSTARAVMPPYSTRLDRCRRRRRGKRLADRCAHANRSGTAAADRWRHATRNGVAAANRYAQARRAECTQTLATHNRTHAAWKRSLQSVIVGP